MYRIILVDDEPLILAGIASLIQWESLGCTLVGKATNGNSAMELILELNPDIVITDIRMPVMNGLELIEACQKQGCEFAFLLLTTWRISSWLSRQSALAPQITWSSWISSPRL